MPATANSILDTTKKAIGVDADNTEFDVDIIMHINSTFSILSQLGVGPVEGFQIEDQSVLWPAYLGSNPLINSVKTLMYLQVRLWFDPPTTSFDLTAKKEQIQELQWRLNVAVDTRPIRSETVILDEDGVPTLSGENPNALIWEIDENQGFPEEVTEDGVVGFDPATGNLWRTY